MVLASLALFTVALSVVGFLLGFPWGVLAFLAGIGLLVYAGYVLSKTTYVEYRE